MNHGENICSKGSKIKVMNVLIATLVLFIWPFSARAAFVFSDVDITPNSVSFAIDGDMTGYALPSVPDYQVQFSIIYSGDIWSWPSYSKTQNTWSAAIFNNKVLENPGNTGGFGVAYNNFTWSHYIGSLIDAFATDRRVSVSLGANYLNPLADDGVISFVWGNGSRSAYHTVLQEVRAWNEISVPEPATIALFGLGLAGLGAVLWRDARHLARREDNP